MPYINYFIWKQILKDSSINDLNYYFYRFNEKTDTFKIDNIINIEEKENALLFNKENKLEIKYIFIINLISIIIKIL